MVRVVVLFLFISIFTIQFVEPSTSTAKTAVVNRLYNLVSNWLTTTQYQNVSFFIADFSKKRNKIRFKFGSSI